MQLPEFATNALGRLAYEFARVQPFIPTYLHLIASALFPIYTGAHSSLSRPASAAKREKAKKKDHPTDSSDDEDEDDEPLRMEGLSSRDAIIFPILAGCTLAGLYFLIKWLQDPAILNKILNWYFALFSVFSIARLVSDGLDVLHSLIFPHDYIDRGVLYRVRPKLKQAIPAIPAATARSSPLPGVLSRLPLPDRITDLLWILHVLPSRKAHVAAHIKPLADIKVSLGLHGFVGLLLGIGVVLWYNFISKPWFLTNIMGFGFAYGTLQILSPTTFWTGSLILCGLFFYDIYFVFYTPMMVTVAKSLDIPVKLLFPRPSEPELEPLPPMPEPPKQSLSMLGLGDVVLPGLIIGLALRFDLFLFYLKKQTALNSSTRKISPQKSRSTGSPSNNTSTLSRSRSRSKARESQSTEDNTTPDIIKAPYQSVAEGWGDRFWTSALLRRPLKQAFPSYMARNAFPKPYFHASLVGYITGMLFTLGAMQITDHAQPALLYLVPGVLISLWGTGWWKGELKAMWEFSDAIEEEEKQEDDPKHKSDEKASDSKSAVVENERQNEEQDAENGEDSSVADRTRSRTQSSIFSAKRGEARAKRLSNALSGRSESTHDAEDSQEEIEPEEQQDAERKTKRRSPKSKPKRQQQKWFSFSVELPSLSPTAPKSRSGQRGKNRASDDEANQRQRYSLRSTASKKGENAVKRQRLS